MAKTIIAVIVILNLAMFAPCRAQVAIPGGGSAPAISAATGSGTSPQVTVEDIVVKKIENGSIYAEDGRKFDISGAKVIDNSHNAVGTKTATLFFQNGEVVQVILK